MSFKYIKNTRIKDPKPLPHKHYHLEQSSTKILSLVQIFDLGSHAQAYTWNTIRDCEF